MSLTTPPTIQELQRKLYLKAKQEPTYRFYALYDKVYRDDILVHAYHLAKANGGAAGVDDMRFEDIEKYGVGRFLVELRQELQESHLKAKLPGELTADLDVTLGGIFTLLRNLRN